MAHEIAHWLGASHNRLRDDLMSMDDRQDLKLGRETVRAIAGK